MPIAENQETERWKRRILCIDGGGIRGTFPATFLAELEQHLDNPIGSYFDLIAGSSTGGIIAIALSLGHRASNILDFYEKLGPKIFGAKDGIIKNFVFGKLYSIRRCYRPKYNSDKLRCALHTVLGARRIGDAKTRLLVPAWNPVTQSVYIYKTAHHPRLRTDYQSLALDVALATSAAPTYFPQHTTHHDLRLIDGGVWANNPAAIAAVEAIAVLGWHRKSLHVLSVGCVEETYTISRRAGLTLGAKAIKLLMDGQSHGALGMVKLLTGHEHEHDRLYRINHTVPLNTYNLDDKRTIQDLKGLGHSMGRDRFTVLKPVFFDHPAEEFTPTYLLKEEHRGD